MNGAVQLPLDLAELTITASGGSLVRRTVLPSGVRILSEQVPGSQSATVGFWVAVGSRDEQPVTYGSTHFLEHLLFKGTKTRTALDIAVSFDAVGGEHNAMTAKEYTCYYAKIRDKDLPMAVAVLADMFTSSLLDAEEFEAERGVILEELAMADDDPSDVVSERFFEAVFGDHPLGRPIGGSPASIGAVDRDAVLAHYRANYRPQDLVISVAGAVDHDELVRWVVERAATAGWDLDVAAAPVMRRDAVHDLIDRGVAARDRRAPDRAGQHPARCRRPRRHRSDAVDARGAQLGARRRDVVAALPGGAREARPGLLGLFVRRELRRRRARRPLRRMLAQERAARSPS